MGRSTTTTRSGGRGAAALVAVLTVLALVLAGCTGAADRPEPATEDTAEVGPDQTAELAFGQVQVQIPAGAVADDGTATLTTGTQPNDAALRDVGMAAASDLIGVELDGTQLTGRATITQQVPDDWPKSWRPVMVWENPAGGWQWLPTRVTAADGKRTAVAKTGHFSDGFLAAFDVRAAGEKAAKAFGEFITGRAGVENPKCEAEDEARETLKVSSDSGDAVKWCLGVEDGAHVLKVSNNRRTLAQLSLPLGTTVLSGAGWGISAANLVRAVGEGLEQFAAGFPSDRTMLLLRPGKTVTVQIPTSSGGGAEITASGVGYLLSILVNAVDMYTTIAGAAGLKPATNADTLWSFLGDGAGKGSN